VCHFWYQSARDMAEESVNRVDPGSLEPKKARKQPNFGGVVDRESAMLGGPMTHTDKPVRDEGWTGSL
jgi:hypothetical protein